MGRQKYEGVKAQGAIRFGSNVLVNGELFTVGGKNYEFRTSGSAGAGNIQVNVGGTAALTAAALIAAINANKPTVPVTAYIDPIENVTVRLEADFPGTNGNLAMSETVVDAGITISGANMTNGEDAGNQVEARNEYVVTALDVAAGCCMISTGLQTPRFMQLEVRTATGLQKAITSLCTFDGTRIKVDSDGATNPAAGDKIVWGAWE